MSNSQILIGIGFVIFLAGGIPAVVGVSNLGVFILCGVLMIIGVLTIMYGRRVGNGQAHD